MEDQILSRAVEQLPIWKVLFITVRGWVLKTEVGLYSLGVFCLRDQIQIGKVSVEDFGSMSCELTKTLAGCMPAILVLNLEAGGSGD